MLAYTYISPGKFELIDKPKPELQSPRDAIVRITLGSICTATNSLTSPRRTTCSRTNWTV
jgi:threonine dehydrogenase-like Zn-dependent dehydrogenase